MEDKPANKALNFLEQNGLVEAYQCNIHLDLLTSLCEHGLPTGDLYQFAALMVLKFQKKWKIKKRNEHTKAAQASALKKKEQEESKREQKLKKGAEERKGKREVVPDEPSARPRVKK